MVKKIRIAAVQLYYNAACYLNYDYLSEPAHILENGHNFGIANLLLDSKPKYQESLNNFKHTIKDEYLQIYSKRIVEFIKKCIVYNIDLIVFPEYSIPYQILEDIKVFQNQVSIVAPSHTVTKECLSFYKEKFSIELNSDDIKKSICPIFVKGSNKIQLIDKLTNSPFEPDLVNGNRIDCFDIPIGVNGDKCSIFVQICSDYIQPFFNNDLLDKVYEYKDKSKVHIVPTFTSHISLGERFFQEAKKQILFTWTSLRKPTVFVNTAEMGGTCFFCRKTSSSRRSDSESDICSYTIPKDDESIFIYDLYPEHSVTPSKRSTIPEPISKCIALLPVLYPNKNVKEFLKVLNGIEYPQDKLNYYIEQKNNCKTLEKNLPKTFINKLNDSITHIKALTSDEVSWYLDYVYIPSLETVQSWRFSHLFKSAKKLQAWWIPSNKDDTEKITKVKNNYYYVQNKLKDSYAISSEVKSKFDFTKYDEFNSFSKISKPEHSVKVKTISDQRSIGLFGFRLISPSLNGDSIKMQIKFLSTLMWEQWVFENIQLELRYVIKNYNPMVIPYGKGIEVILTGMVEADNDENAELESKKFAASLFSILSAIYQDEYLFEPISDAFLEEFGGKKKKYKYKTIFFHRIQKIDEKIRRIPFQGNPTMKEIIQVLYDMKEEAQLRITVEPFNIEKEVSIKKIFDENYIDHKDNYNTKKIDNFSINKTEIDLLTAMNDLDTITVLTPENENQNLHYPCSKISITLFSDENPSYIVPQFIGNQFAGSNKFLYRKFQLSKQNEYVPVTDQNEKLYIEYLSKIGDETLFHLFTKKEAYSVFRLPIGNIPGYSDAPFKMIMTPVDDIPKEGILFGKGAHPGVSNEILVKIKDEDRRRHSYVLGKTGTGKTTFLLNLITQDINDGKGVGVLDPHGDLIDKIMGYIPKERLDDVILFDPTDPENPPGLNLLECDYSNPFHKEFIIQEAVSIFLKLFGHEIFGPRIQDYFRNGCLTIMDNKNNPGTLIDISRLFIDEKFRDAKINEVKDPIAKMFWQGFKQMGYREKQEMIPYFQSKFSPFISNQIIRNIIGQQNSMFNFREAMDNKKILLVNLSKGKLGEINSSLLGMIMISKLAWSAMSRANVPEDNRQDFYLYVDEFQNFITDTFDSILSEARKFRLNLTIANQHLNQLELYSTYEKRNPGLIINSIFGNVGTIVCFRIGINDTNYILKEFGDITGSGLSESEQYLLNLKKYHAVIKLIIDGHSLKPFTMKSVIPITEQSEELGKKIALYSKLKYCPSRKMIEDHLSSTQ